MGTAERSQAHLYSFGADLTSIETKIDTANAGIVVANDGIEIIEDHLHCQMLVAPNLANSLPVIANAAAWNNTGALVEFIAAGAVAAPFDVHFVSATLDNNAQYQFGIYTGLGGAEVLVTSFTFARTGVQERSVPVPVHMKIVPAGTRITVRSATSSANADTASLKLWYHIY